jgi:hypothetical protein
MWLERSAVATAIRDSTLLTAWLSAVHLLGVTLVGGGALLSGLRFAGGLFADQPFDHVVRPAGRAILFGLAISIVTGALLFSSRASAAVQNGFFQLKMLLLLAAVVCQALISRRVGVAAAGAGVTRFIGVLGSALCFGVIVAGCAFILLE